jgi:hypothetical protein
MDLSVFTGVPLVPPHFMVVMTATVLYLVVKAFAVKKVSVAEVFVSPSVNNASDDMLPCVVTGIPAAGVGSRWRHSRGAVAAVTII